MTVNELVLVQGMADTRRALARWNRDPGATLLPWLRLSVAVAAGLLVAVYVVARLTPADPQGLAVPGLNRPVTAGECVHILVRNGLVLALHAMACVAGFMAGSSLALSASKRSGLSRFVHEKAGPLAIAFVTCATLFSLGTQAYASRRGQWEDLLAATFVTVAVAVPVLLASAAIELWVTPHLLEALAA